MLEDLARLQRLVVPARLREHLALRLIHTSICIYILLIMAVYYDIIDHTINYHGLVHVVVALPGMVLRDACASLFHFAKL